MNRELRSVLHLLNPNITDRVESSQSTQKKSHDKRSSSRTFTLGDKVYARNYGQGPAWIKGTIVDTSGPYNVTVEVNLSGLLTSWKRHVDHLLRFLTILRNQLTMVTFQKGRRTLRRKTIHLVLPKFGLI